MMLTSVLFIAGTMLGAQAAWACITVNGTLTIAGNVTTSCVNVNGTILIRAGGRLALTGSSGQISTIDGHIILDGPGSELAFTTSSHTVQGAGQIRGQDSGTLITIDGVTLTNYLAPVGITGAIQIVDGSSAGVLINDGVVDANTSGTLRIAVNNVRSGSADRRWRSTTWCATLDLSAASYTGMAGGLYLTAGQIAVNNTALVTSGRLEMFGGLFEANANVTMGSVGNYLDMRGGTIYAAAGSTFFHN